MKTILKLLVLLLAVLPAPTALGAATTIGNSKITVTADKFTFDENNNTATFTGHVYVVHPSVKVWADTVTTEYGAGGPSDAKTFVATGHVRLETKNQTATGNRAVFEPKSQILTLTGNVLVRTGTSTVSAPSMRVDLSTNTSVFSGGKSGRITSTFTPQ